MTKVLEFFLHLIELFRERSGRELHRIDPRPNRRLSGGVPRDSSCYPYYRQLDDRQLVDENDVEPR
jgi:hypothetical protein